MDYKLIALIVSFIVFTGYVMVYCLWKFGLTKSISITYYYLKKKHRGLFTGALAGFAIPLSIAADNQWHAWAAAMIVCTGLAADFLDKNDLYEDDKKKPAYKIHMFCAYAGVVIGLIGLWAHFGLWQFTVYSAVAIFFLMLLQVKNYIWFIEVIAYYVIALGILINIL